MTNKQAHRLLEKVYPQSTHCLGVECWSYNHGSMSRRENRFRVSILPFLGETCRAFTSTSLELAVKMAIEAIGTNEADAQRFTEEAEIEAAEIEPQETAHFLGCLCPLCDSKKVESATV